MTRQTPTPTFAAALLALALASFTASAQQSQAPGLPEGWRTVQVIVEISETGTNEWVVDVAFTDRDYDEQRAREHLQAWARETGEFVSEPKFELHDVKMADNHVETILHCLFTTHNLVKPEEGSIDLQSIVRAFSRLDDIEIRLWTSGFVYKGWQEFESASVHLTSLVDQNGVDVAVHVKDHDPAKIVIPALYEAPKPVPQQPKPNPPPLATYIGMAVVVSVGAGVLVYYLLRRMAAR
jgi:hypothetical protein